MKALSFAFGVALLLVAVAIAEPSLAQYPEPEALGYDYLLTPEELDELVAPIALYPDPLIAQILPAATFIDQIDEAARYVRRYGKRGIDYQPWDLSVRSLAHYPGVLYMMDQRYDWTATLGQAYLNQPQEVMDAIQRLRAAALDEGNLYSTSQQQVIEEAGVIRIVPAVPQYVYVPVYDPQVVFVEPAVPGFSLVTFGAGFVIGSWLNRDCDWHRHRVYYHGWRGGGWIGRSRPVVRERDTVYVGKSASRVEVNVRIRQHDTQRVRRELRGDVQRHREGTGRPSLGTGPGRAREGELRQAPGAVRPAPERGERRRERRDRGGAAGQSPAQSTPATPPSAVTSPPPATVRAPHAAPAPAPTPVPAPAPITPPRQPEATRQHDQQQMRDVYRGRDVRRSQPASQEGYGGYGSSGEATRYRERGRASRERISRPAPTPAPPQAAPAPAQRPAFRHQPPAPAAQSAPASPPPSRMAPVPRAAPAPQPASPGKSGGAPGPGKMERHERR